MLQYEHHDMALNVIGDKYTVKLSALFRIPVGSMQNDDSLVRQTIENILYRIENVIN